MGRKQDRAQENAQAKDKPQVDRRRFLTGVAVAGAATATTVGAQAATPPVAAARKPAALPPTAHQVAAEGGIPKDMPHLAGKPG
jgi:nitrous oxide reductase